MKSLAALLALAGALAWGVSQETVFDEEVRVGPGKIRTLDLDIEANGRVVCEHHVVSGASGVRVVLLKKGEAAKWVKGEAHSTLAGTAFAHDGSFTHRVAGDAEYRLVLDNRMEGREAALVRLRVTVVRGEGKGPARGPDRARGQAAVWVSVTLFLVICGGAGWRLRRAWVEREERERTA